MRKILSSDYQEAASLVALYMNLPAEQQQLIKGVVIGMGLRKEKYEPEKRKIRPRNGAHAENA